ncbi:MAG TPA: hypothetical protein VG328_07365 [Stellaceae bacterium]|nr:hypothetical protein [Stellaceae bacterium]
MTDTKLVIVACRVIGGVALDKSLRVRGPNKPFTATWPCINNFALTPIAFEVWRRFAIEQADHVALRDGDLFMAPTLAEAVERCRAAAPMVPHSHELVEPEELRLAAE